MSLRLDYPEIAQVLIENGADINAPPGRINGRTAIQSAAESGNIWMAQILLNMNANLNGPAGYEKGLTALQAAIRHGHPLMAGFLLMSGADVNAPPAPIGGLTAVETAAKIGDFNMVKDLMRQGAILDSLTAKSAESVVLAAIAHKNLPMLELFVEHAKANTHETEEDDYASVSSNDDTTSEMEDDRSIPPIVAAAKHKWIEGVRHLLKTGANINCFYYDGGEDSNMTALNWAIFNEDFGMTELLLDSEADLQCPAAEGLYKDALWQALRCDSIEIFDLLLRKYHAPITTFDPNVLVSAVKYTYEDTFLLQSVLEVISKLPRNLFEDQIRNAWNEVSENLRNIDEDVTVKVIKVLLNAGAKIDCSSEHGTLLQVAIRRNFIIVAKFLLEEGAELQVPAIGFTGTPLQEAITNQENQLIYLLLERGADINALPTGDGGATALQAAVRNGHKNLAVDLLERGADVNAPPAKNRGVTALQAAAIRGHIDIAIELLQRGAHVAAESAPSHGRTAIDGAAEHGRKRMLQLLLNHYDGDEDLMAVCERAAGFAQEEGHVEIAQWLREYPRGSTESL